MLADYLKELDLYKEHLRFPEDALVLEMYEIYRAHKIDEYISKEAHNSQENPSDD